MSHEGTGAINLFNMPRQAMPSHAMSHSFENVAVFTVHLDSCELASR